MAKIKDLSGKRFGRLTVIKLDCRKNGKTYWSCICDCGNTCSVRGDHMQRKVGATLSCGCLQKDNIEKNLIEGGKEHRIKPTHGDTGTRFYGIWRHMNDRCYVKSTQQYPNYGGRGITIEWKSYEEFKKDMYTSYCEHVKAYGESETSIERIDVDGNYCKQNCKWVTLYEQHINKRNTILVIMEDGTVVPMCKLVKDLNLNYRTILRRYQTSKHNGTHRIPYNELIKESDINPTTV